MACLSDAASETLSSGRLVAGVELDAAEDAIEPDRFLPGAPPRCCVFTSAEEVDDDISEISLDDTRGRGILVLAFAMIDQVVVGDEEK